MGEEKERYIHKKKERKKPKASRVALEWLLAFAIALLITVFLTQVIIVNAMVPSGSMQDTINPGDRVIGLRTAYWSDDPQRFDIIIFEFPDNPKELFVKRVIGLPGDTVEIVDGMVYVNGEVLQEGDYLSEPTMGSFGPYHVPQDSYFVLGDNRNHSQDSRFWINTYVSRDQVLAKAKWRIYPDPTTLQ